MTIYRENTQYHISGMSLAPLFFSNRLNNTVDLLQLRQENGEQQESSFDEGMAEIRGFDAHRQLDMMVKRIVWEQSTSGRGISLVKRLPSGQILLLRSFHFSRWYQMTDTVFSVKRR